VRLSGIHDDAGDLAIAPSGNRLVYSNGREDDNIWQLSLSGDHVLPPRRLIASTWNETLVAFSPAGDRIAFQSNRSGMEEIWICNRDGSSPAQLTHSGIGLSGSPQWSPDGRTIAFDRSEGGGAFGIYTIDVNGGEPVALVRGQFNNAVPVWSRNGAWIYFTSDRTGRAEVWKIPSRGGVAVQVTRNGGSEAQESLDGRELYYKKAFAQKSALWKMPAEGGSEAKVLESVHQRNFAIGSDGIYYVNRQGKGAEIRFFHLQSGRDKKLASLFARCPGFALSPDGSSLLFAQVDTVASDLMLVENFR
jgi:Tol biopolymer transport system component